MSFFENWKEFRIRAEKQNLSPACKVIYYELLGQFNDAFWADEISLTDNELMRLTRIRSRQTIIDAKSRLKLSGLIDFTASKYSGTTYKLVQLASTSWSEQTAQQTAQQTGQQTGHQTGQQTGQQTAHQERDSYTHTREDVKTLRQEDISTTTTARASEGVRHRWIQATFTNPTELDEEGLAALEKEFGSEKVFFAIGKANQHKKQPTINLALVEAILRNGGKPKGDAGRGKSNTADDDINAQYYNLR